MGDFKFQLTNVFMPSPLCSTNFDIKIDPSPHLNSFPETLAVRANNVLLVPYVNSCFRRRLWKPNFPETLDLLISDSRHPYCEPLHYPPQQGWHLRDTKPHVRLDPRHLLSPYSHVPRWLRTNNHYLHVRLLRPALSCQDQQDTPPPPPGELPPDWLWRGGSQLVPEQMESHDAISR
jgi:hypothetical protein